MLARVLLIIALGIGSTLAVATVQLVCFDTDKARITIAWSAAARERDFRPSFDPPTQIAELQRREAFGVTWLCASASRTPYGSFGPWWHEVDNREPIDAIPTHLRPHLQVSWPKGRSSQVWSRSTHEPRAREQVAKSILITGWPLHALWTQPSYDATWTPTPRWGWYLGRVNLTSNGRPSPREVIVPLHPLWPGFLANSAIYAIAWTVILFGPVALIRATRSRRNLCTKCSYDLRHTPPTSPCPECGAPHQSEARAQALAPSTLDAR